MEKDFDEFVAKRCEKALTQNMEYMEIENDKNVTPEERQSMAEMLCYVQGLKDSEYFKNRFVIKCSQKV